MTKNLDALRRIAERGAPGDLVTLTRATIAELAADLQAGELAQAALAQRPRVAA